MKDGMNQIIQMSVDMAMSKATKAKMGATNEPKISATCSWGLTNKKLVY